MKFSRMAHWMGKPLPAKFQDNPLLSLEELNELAKQFDVMIREYDGKVYLYIDDKGRGFRMR